MINVTQSLDALAMIHGVSDFYENFNGLHLASFVFCFKNYKCNMSVDNDILTILFMNDKCNFKRSWSLSKQEGIESFMEDVKFFLEDSERKITV